MSEVLSYILFGLKYINLVFVFVFFYVKYIGKESAQNMPNKAKGTVIARI